MIQLMISICYEELDELDMKLKLKKSQIVRIGRLCTSYACSGTSIEFVDELKYLGWYILSSKSFKISLHHMRVRFYQCFNSLLVFSDLCTFTLSLQQEAAPHCSCSVFSF